MFGVGLFATVGVLLILGLIFTLLAGILGVFNAFSNPIEWYTGVYGLLVLHSISGEQSNISDLFETKVQLTFSILFDLSSFSVFIGHGTLRRPL